MKKRTLIIVLSLLVALPYSIDAQIGGALKNRLNKAINKAVENKIDSAIQEKQEEQAPEGRPGLGGLLGGKTDVPHRDVYNFTGRIHMVMENYDKKDVIKSDYFTFFNANTANAAFEIKLVDPDNGQQAIPTVFIFDNENRAFMILMQGEGSKTGIISAIPDESELEAQSKEQKEKQEKAPVITKTGNTKVIAGYRCDEYKVVEEGEEGYSMVWMTNDIKIRADKRNWDKTGMPNYYGYPGFENSVMLALDAYDKDKELVMKMETKEISDNFKHSISAEGYAFIKVNFGQAGKK
ncbi:MAG: DUF4412 domain-containing protein [Bacteroidales bacterium]|nr:DUF4412 domain-containing protein [Bacteroidales bacterium]